MALALVLLEVTTGVVAFAVALGLPLALVTAIKFALDHFTTVLKQLQPPLEVTAVLRAH